MVHLLKARVDDAISWLEKARSANPRLQGRALGLQQPMSWRAMARMPLTELVEARRLSGDNRYASIAAFRHPDALGAKLHAVAEDTFFVGLRRPGCRGSEQRP
jgi:hypothetical protein